MPNSNAPDLVPEQQITASHAGATGRTALELLARPVEEYGTFQPPARPGPRPLKSTPTNQRTFDPQANRPDSRPDISQE